MQTEKSDSNTRKNNNSTFSQNSKLPLPFLERDPTQDVAGSYKSRETNISCGTVLPDTALRSLLTHPAWWRSGLDRDAIRFEAELSTVLLGCVSRVVTSETFNLFNAKCFFSVWITCLSSAVQRIMSHQSSMKKFTKWGPFWYDTLLLTSMSLNTL